MLSTEVITRALRLKPGQVYNVNALHADGRRLERLRRFKWIEPKVEVGSGPGKVAITWWVRERGPGRGSLPL